MTKLHPRIASIFLLFFLIYACTSRSTTPTLLVTSTHFATPSQTATYTPTATPTVPPQAVDLGVLGKGSAEDIAWSPDSSWLAVASTIGVDIYDTQTWQISSTISTEQLDGHRANGLTFSPDGKNLILYISSYPSFYLIYNLYNQQISPWPDNPADDPDTAPVFAPDGKTFAILDSSRQNTENGKQSDWFGLELRESLTGKLLHRIQQSDTEQENGITCYRFSPDGTQLAVGSEDNRVSVWDTSSGRLLYNFEYDSDVASIDYSPDGKVLASASLDTTIRFWDMQTGQNLFVLRGFNQGIQFVSFFDNGGKILIGGSDDNIFVAYALNSHHLPTRSLAIQMDIGKQLSNYYPANITTPTRISISPNTRQMAVLNNSNVRIWDLETGESMLSLPGYNSQIYSLASDPTGELLAVADHNIYIWNESTRELVATLEVNGIAITDLAFHPDKQQLAAVVAGKNVEIWNFASQRLIQEIDPDCGAYQVAYSSDGKKLAIACWDNIQIWDTDREILQNKYTKEEGESFQMAFMDDDRQLSIIGENGGRGLDVTTGEKRYSYQPIKSVSGQFTGFSASLAMMGYWESPFYFFDPVTGQGSYEHSNSNEFGLAALSPNGRLVASYDRHKINLFDAASGSTFFSINQDRSYLLSFSSDNRLLITIGYDDTIHLWDISAIIQVAASVPVITATPAATFTPTTTPTPVPVAPITLQPISVPTLESGAIHPETIDQIGKMGELGLGDARAAAWSPDGKSLAVGGSAGEYIFGIGATKPTQFMPTDDALMVLAFSPDGRLLAGQMFNNTIQVWDVPTGRSLYQYDLASPFCWNQELGFSPDSQVLTAYCGALTVRWNMSDGKMIGRNTEAGSHPYTSPDGSRIVEVDMKSAHLVDAKSNEIIQVFDVPDMAPGYAKFSPDGKTLLVWFYHFEVARTGVYVPGNDPVSLIQLWDILPGQTPTLRATLSSGRWLYLSVEMEEPFLGLDFTSDSNRMATASGDGHVQIWDVNTGQLQGTLSDGRRVFFSPDGNRIAVLGQAVKIWEIPPGKYPKVIWNIPGFSESAISLGFTQDGSQLMAASAGQFLVWQRTGGNFSDISNGFDLPGYAVTFAASSDGKWLAYSTRDGLYFGANSSNQPAWRILEKYPDSYYKLGARALAFSPDNAMLAVADPDGKVLLWRLDKLNTPPVALASNAYIAYLQFSPDGKLLLGSENYSSEESTFHLWDTETGKLIRSWDMVAYQSTFHPDGIMLAVTDYEKKTISLIDLRTGDKIREMIGNSYVYKIAFNPDGSLLVAVTNNGIQFWEVASGKLLRELDGSFGDMAFSPDGKTLAIGLYDSRIEYWGVP